MKCKLVILTIVGLITVVPLFSQSRTVTNTDLEKYKQKRLKAEKDYNDNYARMGFPSPEELQKQVEKNRVEREALAARLAAERLRQEQAEAVISGSAGPNQPNVFIIPGGTADRSGYYFSYPYFRGLQYRPYYQYSPLVRVTSGFPILNYNNQPPRPIFSGGRFHRPL